MKKTIFIVAVCLLGSMGLAAQSYDAEETAKLKSFLSQASAEEGKKNFEQLEISSLETVDWGNVSGLYWSATGHLDSLKWAEMKLGGNLDLSDFSGLLVLHCEHNQLKSLNITGDTAMIYNDCYNNELTSVDLSTNINLEYFCCRYNLLTKLDVTHNPKLWHLCSSGNQFEQLDLSNNPELVEFYAANGKLKSIDLSHNKKLQFVALRTNQMTKLDVSNHTKLEQITCYDNKLTELNVSGCTALEWLQCYDNQLTSLDVSTCKSLIRLACHNNKISSLDASACSKLTFINCTNNGMSNIKTSSASGLDVWCENNKFTFSTLPSSWELYTYAPQAEVAVSAPSNKVNLKSEYAIEGTTSVFAWSDNGTAVTPDNNQEGLFSFPKSYVGKKLTCTITNASYPALTMTYQVTLTSPVANELTESNVLVYANGANLYVQVDKPMTMNVYAITGSLVCKRIVGEGESSVALPHGIYLVSLGNGMVRKVVIK